MPDPGFEEFSEKVHFNIAPSQMVPVVRLNKINERVASLVEWGLVPHWTKGKPKMRPINAKAETVSTSGMFKDNHCSDDASAQQLELVGRQVVEFARLRRAAPAILSTGPVEEG